MSAAPLWMNVLIFSSMGLLAIGYFWKPRERHWLRIAGFVGVGIFWGARSWLYFEEGSDAVNIAFTGLAFPFFVYLGWHEWLSYKRDEDLDSLKWATGVTFLAGILYFAVDQSPAVASALIQSVAHSSLWVMNAFGYGGGWYVDPTGFEGGELGAPIVGSGVIIILGCTSYEAIVIFLGAVFATQMRKDPWADYAHVNKKKVARLRALTPERRKWLGLLYTVPVIWILNLVRNVGVIYLYNENTLDDFAAGWGMTGFDFSHIVLGKGLSFVALIIIAFALFKTCPEILDNVNGLLDLPRRGQGGKGGGGPTPREETSASPAAEPGGSAPAPVEA